MLYITVDGDDVGRVITSCYLRNSSEELLAFSNSLREATARMAEKFEFHGFSVIFCAADGIAAYIDEDVNVIELFRELMTYAPIDITFSAGGGATLRESYIALISAKSSGKNCIHLYKDLN